MRRMILIGVAFVVAGGLPGRAPAAESGVRDRAGLFSSEAIREADRALGEIQQRSGWQMIIETVASLGGTAAKEQAFANAKAQQVRGLYVLIARDEHKVQVVPSPSAEAAFPRPKVDAIVAAVTDAFKARQFDKGLRDAVALIGQDAREHPNAPAGAPVTTSRPADARGQAASGVSDGAGIFSPEAVRKAEQVLRDIERDRRWQVVIETVKTLGGKTAKEQAVINSEARQVRGLYLLIAQQEHKVWVAPSHSAEAVFTKPRIDAIVAAVTDAFKVEQFDQGLLDAAELIRQVAATAPPAVPPSAPRAPLATLPNAGARAGDRAPAHPVGAGRDQAPAGPQQADIGRVPGQPPNAGRGQAATGLSGLMVLVLLVIGVILVIWILRSLFRGVAGGSGQSAWGSPAGRAAGGPPYSGMGGRPAAPGYGPGPGYPAGGGYGPPQGGGGGGGFLSSALGGLGGAVVGNILYDKFGRPHPQSHESPGGVVPHESQGMPPGGVAPPPYDPGLAGGEPPAESYDPNAGAGGDWGGAPPEAAPDGGDWGGGAGGDWGGGDTGGGGDWGGGDTGGGGDWGGGGGGDTGGGDAGGGGSW